MYSKIVLVAVLVLSVALAVSAAHGKKEKKHKELKNHHGNKTHECPLKNCMISPEVLNQTQTLWRQSMEECRMEIFSASTSRTRLSMTTSPTLLAMTTATPSKKQKKAMKKLQKKNKNCITACHLKKFFFAGELKEDSVKAFAAKLNATAEKTFNEEFSACLTKGSVDLTTLTMDNNCKSWKAPVKCYHKSLKKACTSTSESEEPIPDDTEGDDSADEEDDSENGSVTP